MRASNISVKRFDFEVVCVCVCSAPQRPEDGVGSLDLELEVVVNCPVWVLGTEQSSARGLCALRC